MFSHIIIVKFSAHNHLSPEYRKGRSHLTPANHYSEGISLSGVTGYTHTHTHSEAVYVCFQVQTDLPLSLPPTRNFRKHLRMVGSRRIKAQSESEKRVCVCVCSLHRHSSARQCVRVCVCVQQYLLVSKCKQESDNMVM